MRVRSARCARIGKYLFFQPGLPREDVRELGSPFVSKLGLRALNRALLARQMLLARKPVTVEAALRNLVGLQAQDPKDPYVALWSRLKRFMPEDLGGLIESRKAVRVALMRGTIHLVTADDAWPLRMWTQPVLDRWLRNGHARSLKEVDLDDVAKGYPSHPLRNGTASVAFSRGQPDAWAADS